MLKTYSKDRCVICDKKSTNNWLGFYVCKEHNHYPAYKIVGDIGKENLRKAFIGQNPELYILYIKE